MIHNYFPKRKESLPPRPESQTGLPRPPRVRVDLVVRDDAQEEVPGERSERFKPAPPPGQGPVLEWYEPTFRNALVAGLGGIVPGIFLTVLCLSVDLAPLRISVFFPLVVVVLFVISKQSDSCAAGADWFAANKRWVNIYELQFIAASTESDKITLKDRSGRKLRIRLETAQKNRDLWDLVYNGILHSLVQGSAEADQETRSKLRLPRQLDHLTIKGTDR